MTEKTVNAYYGTHLPLSSLLKKSSLACGLLRQRKTAVLEKLLRLYRLSAREHPNDPHARLKYMREREFPILKKRGFDESHLHVVLSSSLAVSLKTTVRSRGFWCILEFALPKNKLEPCPLYFDSTQAEHELPVPGEVDLKFLKAVYCAKKSEPGVKKVLTKVCLKRVRVVPVSRLVQ